jgi:uroporphyrinogen decarboxylase
MDLGGAGIASASKEMQVRIRQVLGLKADPDPAFPYFDDAIQKHFGIDFRGIYMKGIPRQSTTDEWGVVDYADAHDNPLRHAAIEDLPKFPWPDPDDERRYKGLREAAKQLYFGTDYAIVGQHVGHGFFEGGCRLRGYEPFMLDIATDPDWVRAFFDILLDLNSRFMAHYLSEVGDYIQVIWLGDDVCTQRGPYISPRKYRELVKPYFAEYIRQIKQHTNARIMHHCCGSCYLLLQDYIDIGIEILNPVQPEAVNMEHTRLKGEYGDRLSFWGGIGMQHILTEGSVREVEQAVKDAFQVLGKDGGFVLAATHTFTEDVPAENVVALFETGKHCMYS